MVHKEDDTKVSQVNVEWMVLSTGAAYELSDFDGTWLRLKEHLFLDIGTGVLIRHQSPGCRPRSLEEYHRHTV